MTKIIAHRGYATNYPENTLSAFRAALNKGAGAIELDVHMLKDGELVVHHDYSLGNPDNGEGLLLDKDLTYIRSLKVGALEHIPTLSEVFEIIGEKLEYEIELKGCSEKFLRKVLALAERYSLMHKIEFTSPHMYILTAAKQINPKVKTGMFVAPLPAWMDKRLGQMLARQHAVLGGIDVLHCPIELIDAQFVDDAHRERLLVHAADCDTDKDLGIALQAGVDQLSTNNLELVVEKAAIASATGG